MVAVVSTTEFPIVSRLRYLRDHLGCSFLNSIHRFNVYFQRKYTKTADADEFTDTLYNIGSFVLYNTVGFILFFLRYILMRKLIPFGYFLLFFAVALINRLQGQCLMAFAFYLSGNINSWAEVCDVL